MAIVPARIEKKTIWGKGLCTITLDQARAFSAGQFFNLGLSIGGLDVRRSYSAASAPGAPLEFFVSEVAGGTLTPSIFSLNEGDTISLEDPALGFFVLAEVPDARTLWMVATGTGLGPYISMLREGSVWNRFERVNVVHGARHEYQFAYGQELRAMAAERKELTYVPVQSGNDGRATDALAGRITTTFAEGRLEETVGAFDAESHMLLCGNPRMIIEMTDALKERGFEKHRRKKPGHFTFEKYW